MEVAEKNPDRTGKQFDMVICMVVYMKKSIVSLCFPMTLGPDLWLLRYCQDSYEVENLDDPQAVWL